jgi:hypothetical protein
VRLGQLHRSHPYRPPRSRVDGSVRSTVSGQCRYAGWQRSSWLGLSRRFSLVVRRVGAPGVRLEGGHRRTDQAGGRLDKRSFAIARPSTPTWPTIPQHGAGTVGTKPVFVDGLMDAKLTIDP